MATTPAQDQSDPWGWNSLMQTQAPSGWMASWAGGGGSSDDPGSDSAIQRWVNSWSPQYDLVDWKALGINESPRIAQSSDSGEGALNPAFFDALTAAGYQPGMQQEVGGRAGAGMNGVIGPDGQPVNGTQWFNDNNDNAFYGAALIGGAVTGANIYGAGLAPAASASTAPGVATTGAVTSPVSAGGSVISTNLGAGGLTAAEQAALATAGTGGTASIAGPGLTATGTTAGTTATGLSTTGLGTAATTAGTGGGGLLSSLGSLNLGQWAQLASSAYGLYQGEQMKDLAKGADPFAPYRGQYAAQLNTLMQDPSSVTTLPGYQAGMKQAEQTLTRQSASQGLTGSGTTAAALANAGANYQGTYFQQYLGQLAGLAGAGASGANGSMAGFAAGSNTQNQSLQNLVKLWGASGG